jgi:hypothetical protein
MLTQTEFVQVQDELQLLTVTAGRVLDEENDVQLVRRLQAIVLYAREALVILQRRAEFDAFGHPAPYAWRAVVGEQS